MGIYNPPASGGSGSSTLNVVSISSAYTATTSNDVIVASGATFTITLPDATLAAAKKVFRFIKTDISLSNIITLAAVSSQTIGGAYFNSVTSVTLNTPGEIYTLVSDGSNWQVLTHDTDTIWQNAGSNVITGTTTNPTKGGTAPSDSSWWRRVGSNMEVRFEFHQTTAGTAGSGDYLFAIPNASVLAVNTAVATAFTTIGTSLGNPSVLGSCEYSITSGSNSAGNGVVSLYDSTHVRLIGESSNALAFQPISSSYYQLSGNPVSYAASFSVPIAGWFP